MEIENKKWIALTLFLISLGFFSLLIQYPPKLYWDESIHERGAEKILEGKGPYKDQMHPPLGREILVVSLYLFGDSPAGGRGLSVIAGAACVALIFLIGVQLTQSLFPSLLPPLLLLSDPLFYLHARMGMLDMFETFFMILSFWIFLKIYLRAPAKRTILLLYLLGTVLGLAFAVKTLAVVLYPVYFGVLMYQSLSSPLLKRNTRGILHLIFAFTLPTLILFWIPYLLIGFSFADIKEHLTWYWEFMRSFKGHPAVMSRWYEWLIVKQPIWYLRYSLDEVRSYAVVCTGNYLFWISAEIVFLVSLFLWRSLPKIIYSIHAIIVLQFAFWAIKPTTHLYYMLTIIPFYALLMGVFLQWLLTRFTSKKKYLLFDASLFIFCCFFIFGYYFPLISGRPLPTTKVNEFLFPGTEGPGEDSKTSQAEESELSPLPSETSPHPPPL